MQEGDSKFFSLLDDILSSTAAFEQLQSAILRMMRRYKSAAEFVRMIVEIMESIQRKLEFLSFMEVA